MVQYSPWRKRARLVHGYFRGLPMWCAWQVTYRCNFRCAICDYWRLKPDPAAEQTVEQIEEGAKRLGRISSFLISIAGGESLLRRDLPEIVRAMARYHFPLVTTNGWLVTEQLARELWEAGLWGVSVSIDYADAAKHDAQRGVKGAFERAVEAVRILVRTRTQPYQRVNVMAVLTGDNLGEMEKLLELSGRLGAWFMVQPYSSAKTGSEAYLAKPPVSETLLKLRKRYRHFLSNPEFLRKFDEALNGGVPGCLAGRAFFNIDNYGYIAPCVEMRSRAVGRIYDAPPAKLLSALRRATRGNRCKSCWYNCRGEIEALYTFKGALHSLPTLLFT